MNIVARSIYPVLFSILTIEGIAQTTPVELAGGHRGFYYQHAFHSKWSDDVKYRFFHTSSLLDLRDKDRQTEAMSQSYLIRSISTSISVGAGIIYVSASGARGSLSVPIFRQAENISFLIVPRMDVWRNPSFELMSAIEYKKSLTNKLGIYARLQCMTTWAGNEHRRSYQYLRIGFSAYGIQFGMAGNLDEYGKEIVVHQNHGLFLRKEF